MPQPALGPTCTPANMQHRGSRDIGGALRQSPRGNECLPRWAGKEIHHEHITALRRTCSARTPYISICFRPTKGALDCRALCARSGRPVCTYVCCVHASQDIAPTLSEWTFRVSDIDVDMDSNIPAHEQPAVVSSFMHRLHSLRAPGAVVRLCVESWDPSTLTTIAAALPELAHLQFSVHLTLLRDHHMAALLPVSSRLRWLEAQECSLGQHHGSRVWEGGELRVERVAVECLARLPALASHSSGDKPVFWCTECEIAWYASQVRLQHAYTHAYTQTHAHTGTHTHTHIHTHDTRHTHANTHTVACMGQVLMCVAGDNMPRPWLSSHRRSLLRAVLSLRFMCVLIHAG